MIAIGVPFSIPGLFGDFVFRILDHHTFICTTCYLLELMSCPLKSLNKIDRCNTNSNSHCVEQRKTAQTNPSINQTNNQTSNFFIKFPHWSKSMIQKYRVGQLKKFPPPSLWPKESTFKPSGLQQLEKGTSRVRYLRYLSRNLTELPQKYPPNM